MQHDILLCSETLVSDLRHVSELLVPGFGQPKYECSFSKMVVFIVCWARINFYVFSLYRNADLD